MSIVEPAAAASAAPAAPAALQVADGIAVIRLDDPGKSVNTVSSRLLRWFEARLGELERQPLRGLVVLSAKRDHFVAGADLEEILELTQPAEVRALLARGHALMARIAALPCPVVAAIHGACLGGGLELALACDLRVATDHPKTRLGLPEVQLGLIPGMGGTQRLPRLIGVADGLDLILTGRQLDARRARQAGLVDEVCHPSQLEQAALRLLAGGKRRPARPAAPVGKRAAGVLAGLPLARRLVYEKARDGVREKTGGHYPAPLRAVDVVQDGLATTLARGLELEAAAFAELVVSPIAKNLMSLFFIKTAVEGRARALGRGVAAEPRIGVLGAGFMGAGIAQVLAARATTVVLKDKDLAALGRGLHFCAERFAEAVKRRRLTAVGMKTGMGRIVPTLDYAAFRDLRFVIEAVFEDIDLKHRVLREVEAVAPDELIFASNTSTIPIARLAAASQRPENVVGMHFFSPVHKMPLLEVIRHPATSERALRATVELGRQMGKTVVVVDDGPGFFTSRVLGPFLNEAVWCLAEGARIDAVDRALTGWGSPVGPLTLLDEVGLDVAFHAGKVVISYLGDRVEAPPVFERMIGEGRLGRKAKRGFYTYGGGPKAVDEEVYRLIGWRPTPLAADEIAERCWLQMLNETARTIEDGVIADPADADLAVIFGFGFPPFRGGLLREADRRGLGWVVDRLDGYAERHGARLAPAQLLRDMASRGERFHGERRAIAV